MKLHSSLNRLALLGLWSLQLLAQTPNKPFALIGAIQEFSLTNPASPRSGGRIVVNNIPVTIPANLIVQMPGSYLTPADIFRGPNGTPATPPQSHSGIALADPNCVKVKFGTPPELRCVAYEAEIIGNIMPNGTYLAGMVHISQHGLNTSDGIVLNVTNGVINVKPPSGSPIRLRLNDPNGRFGPKHSGDHRFKVDDENPTITTLTGYPVCVIDSARPNLCRDANRPSPPNSMRFTIGNTPQPSVGFTYPAGNPNEPIPLRPGDYITFSGTILEDTAGPYISVHTLRANIAAFTSPGANPVYVAVEESRLGAGGRPFPSIQDIETGPGKKAPPPVITTEFRIVGFTTDPTRDVFVSGIDVNPATGAEDSRLFVRLSPPPVPLGRFRGKIGQVSLLPPPREIRARVQNVAEDGGNFTDGAGQAWKFGVYQAPVTEFIFPETTTYGLPPMPMNFESLCFLSAGSGPLKTMGRQGSPEIVGPLSLFPDSGNRPANLADIAGRGFCPLN